MGFAPQVSYRVAPIQSLHQSVQVDAYDEHSNPKRLNSWSNTDHAESYNVMQRIVQALNSESYMIYSKISADRPLSWEIIPYQKCRNFIGRIIQQIQVLWRTTFGGITISDNARCTQTEKLESSLKMFQKLTHPHL